MDIFKEYIPELEWLAQPISLKKNNVYEIYINKKGKIVWWIWIQWIIQAILEKKENEDRKARIKRNIWVIGNTI